MKAIVLACLAAFTGFGATLYNNAFEMLRVTLGVAALALISMNSAVAITYTEVADAGDLPLGAQAIAPGALSLDHILGSLSGTNDNADMFSIFLSGGKTFSATTTLSTTVNFFDTELFLFDGSGRGVYANDDDPNSPPQSALPAGISFTPNVSGIYYLAIAGSAYLPRSPTGFIFPVSGGFLDQSGGVQNAVGPTGPGGASPLTAWSSISSERGAYDIALTGALAGVPEPSTGLLIGLGFAALGVARRRWLR